MAGEVMLINPRRRRSRRKRARARVRHSRPARRRRRRSYALANPRRSRRVARRRSHARHTRRRRHHVSNPRLGSFFGINIGQAAMVGAGFVGTNIASTQLLKVLPAEWQAGQAAPLARAGSKLAVAVGGGMVLKMFKQHSLANAWTLGGGIAAVVDLATSYLLPALGLSDYETGMVTGYETGVLTGSAAPLAPGSDYVDSTGPYGGSIYG